MIDDDFEWDDTKAASNEAKHGVSFESAKAVFNDTLAVEDFDPEADEPRYTITGMSSGQLLTVVYTERYDRTRIISARKATREDTDEYFKK